MFILNTDDTDAFYWIQVIQMFILDIEDKPVCTGYRGHRC